MIRWLLIGLVIYMIYRLIVGPGGKRRKNPFFTFHFGHIPNDQKPGSKTRKNSNSKAHLDQIEDAEFEDITEEDITDKKIDR